MDLLGLEMKPYGLLAKIMWKPTLKILHPFPKRKVADLVYLTKSDIIFSKLKVLLLLSQSVHDMANCRPCSTFTSSYEVALYCGQRFLYSVSRLSEIQCLSCLDALCSWLFWWLWTQGLLLAIPPKKAN